jgi:virulence-associated protein VapD
MAKRENRKSANFDLDTASLIEVFGEKNRRRGYSEIKRFMVRNGFEHRQYSGYVSEKRMSYVDTYDLIKALKKQCPWLQNCAKKFDITDYMAESDAIEFVTSFLGDSDTLDL